MGKVNTFDDLYGLVKNTIDEQVAVRTKHLTDEIEQLKKDKADLLNLLLEKSTLCNEYRDIIDAMKLGDDGR